MTAQERSGRMLEAFLAAETPVILPNEKIVFTRTIRDIPDYFTPSEWEQISTTHFIHEKGEVFNLSPDYERVLAEGLDSRKAAAKKGLETADARGRIFLESAIRSIEAVQNLIDRYALEAEKIGQQDIAEVLPGSARRRGEKLPPGVAAAAHYALLDMGGGQLPQHARTD